MSIDESGRRGVGRPGGVGHISRDGHKVYSGKCDVRLDKQELSMLNRLSEANGVTRSDVMRRALRDYYRYNTDSSGEE